MDSGDAFVEAILSVEDEVTEEEKTRLMEAALEAKDRERSMLLRKRDRLLAVEEAAEKLVAEFLEADGGNKNFDEKAMMEAIVVVGAAAMAMMVEDLATFRKKGD